MVDDALWQPAGAPRRAFLAGCLADLDERTGGRLVVRRGRPREVVALVARETEAAAVYVSADFGPYGRIRDQAVAEEAALTAVGSPYAVDPGEIRSAAGEPYKVFTPFYRAWREYGWGQPAEPPQGVRWAGGVPSDGPPPAPDDLTAALPPAGEGAGRRRLDDFLVAVADYHRHRDRPDLDTTSRLSPYLKFGCLHPRQVLARLGRSAGAEKLRRELAWREFYADVLWRRPESARQALQPAMRFIEVDRGPRTDARFEAWAEGRTGYPIVDAGLRQLRAEGWMPNRVRMVVASFLVKDLHVDWARGAAWFMEGLVDGDLASNQHNWQWVAGTGTDPAPFFRIFNPVTQGKEHDPHGDYVRRWVPELAGVAGAAAHEPWKAPAAARLGYPDRIVDHAEERREALARYGAIREGRRARG